MLGVVDLGMFRREVNYTVLGEIKVRRDWMR
jgi:hypothetical protein